MSLHEELCKLKINLTYDEFHGKPQISLMSKVMSKVTLLEVTPLFHRY